MANPGTEPTPESAASQAAPQPQTVTHPETLQAIYANFAQVTGTPEELVLDFGLNAQNPGTTTSPVRVSQRLVLNYITAKRLWMLLGGTIQRHEQMFGVLETDVRKRLVPQGQR